MSLSSFFMPSRMADKDSSLAGAAHPVAGLICLFGFFLHITLSDPLLNSLGFHYSGEEGRFYEKIHPGTVFIFLSFLVLLCDGGNPIRRAGRIFRDYTICSALFLLYVAMFLFMALRSGPAGLAFIIDTHMTVPLGVIVLAHTPLSYCRKAAGFFVAVAVMNGLIGMAESFGRFRLFAFDPTWNVLHEEHFRASALRGHPLNNAMFTSVALFVALALRYARLLKILTVFVLMASLVAFGSRVGLVFSAGALAVYGCVQVRDFISRQRMSMQQGFLLAAGVVFIPICFVVGLYLLVSSPMGERLAATWGWEQSAQSRILAFQVLRYMSPEEILTGIPAGRIIAITDHLRMTMPFSDIENPWLMMFMNLGAFLFPFWLMATLAFALYLMRGRPLALQIAVLAYFITASTSNSFGRKDSTYLIMACAVTCAARGLLSARGKART
ncbi:MAG: VpsF family polysaccharide biosynthesis protein [Alphaproteobacteria bacterium]|nr:VpsF family polysaccharide biosynthesis protein [Alphaproteobacteria bacterium]